jgi:predicted porin
MMSRRLSAIVALLAAGAASQSLYAGTDPRTSAEIFGRVRLSADLVDNEEQSGLTPGHSMWLGLRVSHEIKPGLRIRMHIEEDLGVGEGRFAPRHRDAFLALDGCIGTLRGGYMNTPLRDAGRTGDLFNGQVGDSRNLTRLRSTLSGADFDRRLPNSIHYQTPQSHPFGVQLQYSSDTAAANRPKSAGDRAWAAGASWTGTHFVVSLGHQHDTAARDDTRLLPWATRLGARANLGKWTVVTQMQRARLQTDEDVLTLGAGASRELGHGFTLKGQVYRSSSSNPGRDGCMWALGADWRLRDGLYVQLSYAAAQNEPFSRYNVADSTTAQLTPRVGARNRGLSLLVRYDFALSSFGPRSRAPKSSIQGTD